ncbi:3-keto-disaccharide hydrolase [Tautonia rosea]|uniref:3-keto-disaccharide hydrolase n=1 Tax=Tautonia rosea TaxID=2728037 RepID=UPI001F44657D|nr:DUF1080 domain-containing protein [Tautonia rosea]
MTALTRIMYGAAFLGLVTAAAIAATPREETSQDFNTIFDGTNADSWINNANGEPIASTVVQEDGLNPHGVGAYVVLYKEPVKDFVLDFDYKLTPGCNSGIFLRVGNPKDPVMTGLEVAIDDTKGTGFHDSGAFYDLVKPEANTQKSAGEWNHMTITARGPIITVELNGEQINTIDQSQFSESGKRPDGSSHKFRNVAIADLIQEGYFGFQDHGQNCWYTNVRLKKLDQ